GPYAEAVGWPRDGDPVDERRRHDRVGDVQHVAGAREAHERAADRGAGAAGHVEQKTIQDVQGAGVRETDEVASDVEHTAAGDVDEVPPGDGQQARLQRHHGDSVVRDGDLGAVDEVDGVVASGEGGPALQVEERCRRFEQRHVDLVRTAAHVYHRAAV